MPVSSLGAVEASRAGSRKHLSDLRLSAELDSSQGTR